MDDGVNVLALTKGSERYIFIYDDEELASLKKTFGRFACNEELSFTWYDAAVLLSKLKYPPTRFLK
jgi:hypothetical protein